MNLKKSLLSLAVIASLHSVYADETAKMGEVTVVSAAGFEQNITDAPATITVISGAELQKKSYTDVADALKNVPGVFVDGGGANQSIIMRGMASDYTLFLIDGRPMQNADAFTPNGNLLGVQMNFLPSVENIERIEIIRGPASSLYGSDAMGGVINIITKKNINKTSAGITYEYIAADSSNDINNDGMNTTMYINTPLIDNLLSLSLNGSYNYTEESDYQANNTESAGSDPEYKKKNLGVKFTLTPDEYNTLTLGYMYNKQERYYNEGKSLEEGEEERSYISYKENYYLTHDYRVKDYSISSYVNYDEARNPSRTNATTGNGIEADTLTFNTQGTYFFENNAATLGFNYKKETLDDGATSALNDDIVNMEAYQYALFIEDEWAITDSLSLTVGGRLDKNEYFGTHFSPKAYAVYHINNNFTIKGGVTTGYKTPTLRNTAPNYAAVSRGGVSIGNPDLEPEESVNYEAAIAYNNDDIGLNSTLTVYQTDFKNKITRSDYVCAQNAPCTYNGVTYDPHQYGYKVRINVDEAEIRGIELTTDYYITSALKYRHSYTYTDSEQKTGDSAGEPLNDISKHMFNVGLDWEVNNKLDMWTQVNYRSHTANEEDGDPSYTLADLGLVYDLAENLTLSAGVYNLMNKEINRDEYSMVLDGRRYSVAMQMKF